VEDYDNAYDLGWRVARGNWPWPTLEMLGWNSYQKVGFNDGYRSYQIRSAR
jgi:hypothetical protein